MSTPRDRSHLAELAAGPIDAEDVRVLGEIAALYQSLDPVPSALVERIQFGITLDALHAEVAELQRNGERVGGRSGAATADQTVTFTSASLTTMVAITSISAGRARLDGWVAPGDGIAVELRVIGETRHTTADSDGRFVFDDVPRGLAQLVLRRPGTPAPPPVITPSIEL
ncbi:MAG: hypothetical protein JWO57_3566 [Pseudonocardiales bacterium]|jgi:hypothetical protein|nr:hypothetical protein [Pseudonocardiales bacterium]